MPLHASSENREEIGERLSFTLPRELDQRLRTFAADTERSCAAVVRLALRQLLTGGHAQTPHPEREHPRTPACNEKERQVI
jgi:hypothetical protein